jgi:hypothetical protein
MAIAHASPRLPTTIPAPPTARDAERATIPPEEHAARLHRTRLFVSGVLVGFWIGTGTCLLYPRGTLEVSLSARTLLAHEAHAAVTEIRGVLR